MGMRGYPGVGAKEERNDALLLASTELEPAALLAAAETTATATAARARFLGLGFVDRQRASIHL
jgi:hypothetical protein